MMPFTTWSWSYVSQVDAMRQKFLSIGRRRFLSLRSLRGLLSARKIPDKY
jgi:hypothetical protein